MTEPTPKRSMRKLLQRIAKEQEQAGNPVTEEEAQRLADEAVAEVRREMAQEQAAKETDKE